jgi:hypothetical protein
MVLRAGDRTMNFTIEHHHGVCAEPAADASELR